MAIATADEFLSVLEKSELLESKQLAEVLREYRNGEDAAAVARTLVQQELLTRWQAAQLLAGRSSFFLGKYKLIELLGRGGMGGVFLGEHTTMNRRVALKILSRKIGKDPASLERFLSEARAIATLDHPNIVQAYSVDHESDRYFIVMEYIDGRDLQQVVEEDGPLDFETAADYIRQAAEGLSHGHGRKMIHCDIKPSNLLVNNQGVVKIVDMGLPRLTGDEEDADQDDDRVLGTVDYLAPEQALKEPDFDHRADVYSLGCTFYFLLTGHPPFPEGLLHERLMKHQAMEPTSIVQERPDTPADLEALCQKMMAKRPQDRPQTAEEVRRILFERRSPVRKPKRVAPPARKAERSEEPVAAGMPLIDVGPKPRSKPRLKSKPKPAAGVAAQAAGSSEEAGPLQLRRKKILVISGIAGAVLVVGLAVAIPLILMSGPEPDEKKQAQTDARQKQSGADNEKAKVPAPADEPPADDPQTDFPAVSTQPPEQSLTVDPPTEDPPTEDPPTKDPPSEDPPMEDPPTEDPPTEDPPAEDPPAKDPEPPKPEKKDPFRDLMAVADLPVPDGAVSAGPPDAAVSLGRLYVEPDSSCNIELLGGESAIKGSRQFDMDRDGSGTSWLIHLNSATRTSTTSKPIELARVWLDKEALQFQWREGAGQARTAKCLLNCGLRVSIDGETRWLPLGRPQELEPIEVDLDRGQKRQMLPTDRLPETDTLRLQITSLEGPFPKHEFKPGDTVAVGGKTDIALQGQNLPDFKLRVALEAKGRVTSVVVSAFYTLPGQQESVFRAKEAAALMNQALAQQQQMQSVVGRLPGNQKKAVEQQIQALETGIGQLRSLGEVCQAMHKTGKIHFRVFSVVDDQEIDLFVTRTAAAGEPEDL